MTYADTITLLLCLFTVLLALHGTKPHIADHAAPPAAAGIVPLPPIIAPLRALADMPHPVDKAGTEDAGGVTDAPRRADGATIVPADGAANDSAIHYAVDANQNAVTPSATDTADNTARRPVVGTSSASAVLWHAAATPRMPISPPPRAATTTPMHQAALAKTGDRITIFQFSSATFFSSGSANLNESGQAILRGLLDRLRSAEFAGYRITVEGHTDDSPIRNALFASNWELSAARAAAVVRFFIEHGIPQQQLRAAGYADTRPLAANRDANGRAIPVNQARNRRVVVELEKIEPATPDSAEH